MQVIRFKKTVLSLLILLAILVVLLRTIYLQMDFSYITRSTTQTELLQTQDPSQETSSKLDDKFLVNTLGCKMTRLPVMTSLIQKFFVPPDPIDCSPPSITESDECKNLS